jgi:hypothetical protein
MLALKGWNISDLVIISVSASVMTIAIKNLIISIPYSPI